MASLGLAGFPAAIVGFFAKIVLGALLDRGIIVVDIQLDKLKEGLKEIEWKTAIEKAYGDALKKVYSEEEKNAIRKEYLDALSKYASFGNGVSDNSGS